MLVHLIADYGHGDLAFAEVRQRLAAFLPEAEVFVVPVPAFDSLSAGFCAAQLALNEGPTPRAVYMNVAPRADQLDPRPGNQGERLVAALVADGVVVVGVNSQHSFSFLRDEAWSEAPAAARPHVERRARSLAPPVHHRAGATSSARSVQVSC